MLYVTSVQHIPKGCMITFLITAFTILWHYLCHSWVPCDEAYWPPRPGGNILAAESAVRWLPVECGMLMAMHHHIESTPHAHYCPCTSHILVPNQLPVTYMSTKHKKMLRQHRRTMLNGLNDSISAIFIGRTRLTDWVQSILPYLQTLGI